MSWKTRKVPVYKKEVILDAIKREGLIADAWGYEGEYCIWVNDYGMEKEEIWDKLPTPIYGYKCAHYDNEHIEKVAYFILDGYPEMWRLEKIYYRIPVIEPLIDWYYDVRDWVYRKKHGLNG